VVEHCVDIAGVASSILATPTIKNLANPMGWRGFYLPESLRQIDHFGHRLGTECLFLPLRLGTQWARNAYGSLKSATREWIRCRLSWADDALHIFTASGEQ
jgi:hypothetical protein